MKQELPLLTEYLLPPPPLPRRPTTVGYDNYPFPPDLTPREIDILRLAIAELHIKKISQRLNTSLRNVEKYISRIQTKIDRYSKEFPFSDILKNKC